MLSVRFKVIPSLTFVKKFLSRLSASVSEYKYFISRYAREGEETWEIFFVLLVVFFRIGQRNSMVSREKQTLKSGQSELEFQVNGSHYPAVRPQQVT